jgi:hypothetical protein
MRAESPVESSARETAAPVEEIPQDQPVAAFEVGIGAPALLSGDQGEVGVGGGGCVKAIGRLGRGRNYEGMRSRRLRRDGAAKNDEKTKNAEHTKSVTVRRARRLWCVAAIHGRADAESTGQPDDRL